MSWPVLLALLALAAALVQRWRSAHDGEFGLDGFVVQTTLLLGAVGLVSTGLALAGVFTAINLAVGCAGLAAAGWPWRGAKTVGRPAPPVPPGRFILALLIVLGASAARLPSIPAPLAGRDQGTYTLRAQHTVRTGEMGLVDPVLARASEEASDRPGPTDISGLYPRSDEQWRRGLYETSYRPGFYLVDRDRGEVVPQFLHLHPMLMAASGLALGPSNVGAVVYLEALLWLLAFYAVARRLWPRGPWAELALALVAFSPLAIWTNRIALTETLTAALFASAVLCVLRARDGEPKLLLVAAFAFGLTAWVRGNAWITGPVMMAVLLGRPRVFRPGRGALLTLTACLLSSVVVHAMTGFPYLYDELRRLLSAANQFGSEAIIGGAILLTLIVVGLDLGLTLGLRRPPRVFLRVLGHAPKLLALFCVGGIAAYVGFWAQGPLKPYSRLDPAPILLGPFMLTLAAAGLVLTARAWRPRWRQADFWLLALASVPALTLALYARRNLPQLGLYYYGRYLVPELLPVAALLATTALNQLHDRLAKWRPPVALGIVVAATTGLLWSTSGYLLTHPQTRLREFEQAQTAVEFLAEHTETNAIIIAGGEGWHHGHTYNQVGGALAIGHGRQVLPYRTREAAYATLHELLIGGASAQADPPPVYLLLNEASQNYTRADGHLVAGIDDVVAGPFTVRDATMLELFTHRLTPVTDTRPIRVTRDALRMGLLRVEVDPAKLKATRNYALGGLTRAQLEQSGVRIKGPKPAGTHHCLHPKKPLSIVFERPPAGPGQLVVVAESGTGRMNENWQVVADGDPLALRMPKSGRRERDTLGPFMRPEHPRRMKVTGSKQPTVGAECPHGSIAELRWLPLSGSRLASLASQSATTIAPQDDLGNPVTPTRWVSARALSRYRPGTRPSPEVQARSLELRPGQSLAFAPIEAPGGGAGAQVDVVVRLTGTSVGPDARIIVSVNGVEIATIDPPDARDGSWPSEVTRVRLEDALIRAELRLEGDSDPNHFIWVRDVAFFGTKVEVESHLGP